MEQSLRLAERRGLLGSGRGLSSVQQFGLQLLIQEDARLAGVEKTERIKQAAVASGSLPPHVAYPDFFLPPEQEDVVEESEGGDFTAEEVTPDYAAVEWEVPSEMEDPEALLDQLTEFNNLTLLESEAGDDPEGEWQ